MYDESVRCNRCGYCKNTCPTYVFTNRENQVARGRNNYVRALNEGLLELDAGAKSLIFECLMCDACVLSCHPSVKTDKIVAAARAAYYEKFGRPLIQQFIFNTLLWDEKKLARLLKLAALGKNTGLSGLVRVLRILGWYGKTIATAESLMPRVPRRFFREMERTCEVSGGGTLKVAYFVGCAINFVMPHIGAATLQVLRERGITVEILDNMCCGLPPYAYGDLNNARAFARKNLDCMRNSDPDIILTDCASCASFLKEYPELLESDREYADLAGKMAAKIREVTQFLEPNSNEEAGLNGVKVTYHDPCHLNHYMRESNAPRALLKNLSGIEFVELPESDWCCGGAGSYNISHVDMSEKILDRKMDNVEKTGAEILTTACPSCVMQLSYGVRRRKLDVEVKHVVELLHRLETE